MMMNLLTKLYKSGAVWLMILVAVVMGFYKVIKPTEPEYSHLQESALSELATRAGSWTAQIQVPRDRTVFLTLERDPFGRVSDVLRREIWQSDRFNLQDYTMLEKLCRLIHWTRPTVGSRREAAGIARSRECTYGIWGVVREFSDVQGQSRLDLHLELIPASGGEPLLEEDFLIEKTSGLSLGSAGAGGESFDSDFSLFTLIFFWIIFTLLLPIASFPLARRIVTGDSNAATLGLLIGYVLVSTTAAYVLLLRQAGSWITGIVLILSCGLALYYDWRALSLIKKVSE